MMGACPAPDKGTASEALVGLVVTESVAEAGPGAKGVKLTVRDSVWPAFSVVVPLKPLTAKGTLVVTAFTVIAEFPELVSVNDWVVLVVPTRACPKFNEVALGVNVAVGGGVGGLGVVVVSPLQPADFITTTARSTMRRPMVHIDPAEKLNLNARRTDLISQ